MRFDIYLVEFASLVLFLVALQQERFRSKPTAVLLVVGLIYGILLEILDMALFESYSYSPEFFLQIFGAPICIGLLWSLILVSSMKITDSIGVFPWAKPMSDGALCVLLDLAIDVVAIRLGYWSWTIELNEGFFGVPANNFYSWVFVAVAFSTCARLIISRGQVRYLFAVPFLAYLMLFLMFIAVAILKWALKLEFEYQLFAFFWILLLIGFSCILFLREKATQQTKKSIPNIYIYTRISIHFYFIAASIAIGLYQDIPYLILVSLLVFSLDTLILLWSREPNKHS